MQRKTAHKTKSCNDLLIIWVSIRETDGTIKLTRHYLIFKMKRVLSLAIDLCSQVTIRPPIRSASRRNSRLGSSRPPKDLDGKYLRERNVDGAGGFSIRQIGSGPEIFVHSLGIFKRCDSKPAQGEKVIELYATLQTPLRAYLGTFSLSADEVDDVIQEVFVRLIRHLREQTMALSRRNSGTRTTAAGCSGWRTTS
jgi:hypothetical protein